MRPTDENQHGSTRPNLMSPSRPGGGEDNILAMLERDAGRGRASQFSSHPRTVWYAGAGAVVVAMVAALGWLAWENATKTRELPLEATRALPAGDTRIAAAPVAPVALAAASIQTVQPLPAAAATASIEPGKSTIAASGAAITHAEQATPAPAAVPRHVEVAALPTTGAAIIDSPAAPAEAPVLLAQAGTNAPAVPEARAQAAQPSRLPPLVLLPPEEAAPKRKPAAPVAAAATPKPIAAAPSKAAAASRPVTRADAAPAPRRTAKADAAPASRPAAKAPPHRPARPVLARTKKAQATAAPAKSQDASADTDVALISAIIMHSSKHAGERAKAEAAKPAAKR